MRESIDVVLITKSVNEDRLQKQTVAEFSHIKLHVDFSKQRKKMLPILPPMSDFVSII